MGRGLHFSDKTIQRRLTRDFIPVAQDYAHTERRQLTDALHTFYRKVISQRKKLDFALVTPGATQGYYTFDSAGRLYEAYTFVSVERGKETIMPGMLDRALVAYRQNPPERTHTPGPRNPIYPSPPASTLIARV